MIKKLAVLAFVLGICAQGYASDEVKTEREKDYEPPFKKIAIDMSAKYRDDVVTELDLSYNEHLTDINFILGFTSLIKLDLYGCFNLKDNYRPISQLINLEILDLYGAGLTTTEYLKPLIKLNELTIRCINLGQNIDHIGHLKLRKLEILGEPWDGVARLSQLTSLESLTLKDFISDDDKGTFPLLDFLTNLKNLRYLDLSYNQNIYYIKPLIKLTNLAHLNLRCSGRKHLSYDAKIKDIELSGQIKSLEYLNISFINDEYFDPKIYHNDYSFVTQLEKLQTLVIDKTDFEVEIPKYLSEGKFKLIREK